MKRIALPRLPWRSAPDAPIDPPAPAAAAVSAGAATWEALTSVEGLRAAWRKVKANGGGPGVDGERLADFAADLDRNLGTLSHALRQGGYRPQKVLRVLVPKASGERRPLALLTIRDRIVQRAMHDALAPAYERAFLPCSFGFREHLATRDAVDAVAQARRRGLRWVVDGDIRQCFEHIDHALLMAALRRDVSDRRTLRLIELFLKARVFNEWAGGGDLAGARGALQGGALSPLLCNVYLHPFDLTLTSAGLALVRYADDWVVLCKTRREAEAALARASSELAQLRLALNPYKTRITSFDQGFSFLGAFFVRDEQYWLTPPAAPRARAVRGRTGGRDGDLLRP